MPHLFSGFSAWRQYFRPISAPTAPQESLSETSLPFDALPVLPPGELLLRCRGNVSRIEELAGTTQKHFADYYLETLHRFACYVQQRPASPASYAHPGGMLAVGLETAATALKIRQAYLLPAGAVPEEAVLKKDRWTFAVFTAALLHDLARPATEQKITLFDGKTTRTWNPWTGAMADVPDIVAYRVECAPRRNPKTLPSAALMLAPFIIAPAGLTWLADDADVFSAWLACVARDKRLAGVLGEIIGKALRGSGSTDAPAEETPMTQTPTDADPPPMLPQGPQGVDGLPMHERLLTGLRRLIDDGGIPFNTLDAHGWRTGEDIWLQTPTVTEALREWLAQQESGDIPGNNQKVLDVLHREEVLVPCDGKAVWRVAVREGEAERIVTALWIQVGRIWPNLESAPADFAGTVAPIKPESDENTQDKEAPAAKFVEWLRKGIAQGQIPYNEDNAHVHIVPEGVLLVAPGLFQDFVSECGGGRWETVQQLFIKRKAHVRTQSGDNIHHYVDGASQVPLSGFLLKDASLVFDDSILAPNPFIRRLGDDGL